LQLRISGKRLIHERVDELRDAITTFATGPVPPPPDAVDALSNFPWFTVPQLRELDTELARALRELKVARGLTETATVPNVVQAHERLVNTISWLLLPNQRPAQPLDKVKVN